MQKDSYNGSEEASKKAPMAKTAPCVLASVLQAASSRRHLELNFRAKNRAKKHIDCKAPSLRHTPLAATPLRSNFRATSLASFADWLPAHFPRAVARDRAREDILRNSVVARAGQR